MPQNHHHHHRDIVCSTTVFPGFEISGRMWNGIMCSIFALPWFFIAIGIKLTNLWPLLPRILPQYIVMNWNIHVVRTTLLTPTSSYLRRRRNDILLQFLFLVDRQERWVASQEQDTTPSGIISPTISYQRTTSLVSRRRRDVPITMAWTLHKRWIWYVILPIDGTIICKRKDTTISSYEDIGNNTTNTTISYMKMFSERMCSYVPFC